MKKEHRSIVSFIILWIFLISSFLVFAWVLVLEASGYRMNWASLRLSPTSLIMLDGQPKQVQIKINGESKKGIFPYRLPKVLPGQYDIVVSAPGYADWTKTVRLEGGHGVIFDKILLFASEPKITDASDRYTAENLKKDFTNQSTAVEIRNNNEIWYNDELVTRFSQNISGAIITANRLHVIFQTGNEIKTMEMDGTNITNLVKLEKDTPISFALYGNHLIFEDKDKIFDAQITN